MSSFSFKDAFDKVNQGPLPYLIVFAHIVTGTLLVYFQPRSNLAFLVLMSSFLSLYFFNTSNRFKITAAVVMTLLIMPILGVRNIFYLEVIFQISVFAALALGLNIVVGFAGLLDLGYVAFYAVGAYLWAFFGSQQFFVLPYAPGTQPSDLPFLLAGDFFYLFMMLGVIVAAMTGILLGLPVLRVRGDYLAIVTLGFGEVIRVLANNLDKPLNFTNGPQGITPIQRPSMPDWVVDWFNTIFGPLVGHEVNTSHMYNLWFYILALMVIMVIVFVTKRLDDSAMGRAWTAVREDETAAIAQGIPLVKTKLSAFAVGASFAGIMGVLLAASRTFISPESFSFMQSIGVLSMVILGGSGSIPGVILGAATITILNLQVLQGFSLYLNELRQSDAIIPIINFAWSDLSTQLDPAKYQRLLFGLILILMMIFRPQGLIPAKRRERKLALEKTE
ncbi:ABC transporter permease subunit [Desulfopila aestuarii]|uniref:Amino acid/amide ABC transporter membrane protein 2, HAAT family n=1 Tax=Desulfopila aestuarii DSM 18488 TaxID=1121416 RepID=A0A1M7YD37_9BACT|nr:branched-chain amino acid ABC transporter permease [Desulfopila aestuarii]SHO50523.1 amino acid/amide ABC transporter membrane protein 2, HAAT family [Desulfopila aestuarii DSM 18488]